MATRTWITLACLLTGSALAGCGDTAGADSGGDNSDFSMVPDLTSVTADMTKAPGDMAGGDMTVPGDMVTPRDMVPPPDLVPGPQNMMVMVGQNGTNTFSPKTVTIKVGDMVTWTWAAGGHNVVSGMNGVADNKFCSPFDANCSMTPTSQVGSVFQHVFAAAGTFPYFCSVHFGSGMTGTITVN